MYMSEQ